MAVRAARALALALALRPCRSLSAADIAAAHTERAGDVCGLPDDGAIYPPVVLRECDEPLCEGCADLRGVWAGDLPETGDHFEERIEQCGSRVVVAGPVGDGAHRYSHDFAAADGTYASGADDYDPAKLPACAAAKLKADFAWGCLVTTSPALGEATRCPLEDGTIEYADPSRFDGAMTLTFKAALYDERLPYHVDRKDGLVGSGEAHRYLVFFLVLTGLAFVVSWGLAYLVATHPALGEGEPTVVYLC